MKHLVIIIAGLATILTLVTDASAQACPGFASNAKTSQVIEHGDIDESSGLAASQAQPGLFWTHNDSGHDARVYALDEQGLHVGTLSFGDTDFHDAEDIAVAPCEPGSGESCIYLGDIGDNRDRRSQVVVYKLPEPELPDERPFDIQASSVERIVIQYDEGPRNAETLMVHPGTLDLYIVEKSKGAAAGVWRASGDTRGQPAVQVARRVATINTPSPIVLGRFVTAGDISPDGRRLSLRTYLAVFSWCIPEDESLADALADKPTVNSTPGMIQSEALAYDRDGRSIWLTSELRPTPLIELELAKVKTEE